MSDFSKEYARALYDLCKEENITSDTLSELLVIDSLIRENKDYKKLLDTPSISLNERINIIDDAFSSCSLYVKNFIKLLCENKKFYEFSSCAKEFNKIYDKENNIERLEAVTCVPLSDVQVKKLKEKAEKIISKNVIITNKLDESILGGVILKFSNSLIDGSVKNKLDTLKNVIKGSE